MCLYILQIVTKLHAILRPFLLRRVKSEVENGLPAKREFILYAPLTPTQRDLYQNILDKSLYETEDGRKVGGWVGERRGFSFSLENCIKPYKMLM